MFVCLCKSVTDHEIRSAVDDGVRSFESMQERLEVSTVCGACTCEVKQIMQKRLEKEVQVREIVLGLQAATI
ncbi:hypothetical protein NBRC116583_04410 [Arenicella sp. 4NH20-0111]|uniref:(2Fe-2S)-binding protein n=1 Tax=Arenicella sp. 4NH20-0111 TaxID=3127648 RepID=UPI00310673E8